MPPGPGGRAVRETATSGAAHRSRHGVKGHCCTPNGYRQRDQPVKGARRRRDRRHYGAADNDESRTPFWVAKPVTDSNLNRLPKPKQVANPEKLLDPERLPKPKRLRKANRITNPEWLPNINGITDTNGLPGVDRITNADGFSNPRADASLAGVGLADAHLDANGFPGTLGCPHRTARQDRTGFPGTSSSRTGSSPSRCGGTPAGGHLAAAGRQPAERPDGSPVAEPGRRQRR